MPELTIIVSPELAATNAACMVEYWLGTSSVVGLDNDGRMVDNAAIVVARRRDNRIAAFIFNLACTRSTG